MWSRINFFKSTHTQTEKLLGEKRRQKTLNLSYKINISNYQKCKLKRFFTKKNFSVCKTCHFAFKKNYNNAYKNKNLRTIINSTKHFKICGIMTIFCIFIGIIIIYFESKMAGFTN